MSWVERVPGFEKVVCESDGIRGLMDLYLAVELRR